ncbi:MAG: hypothetical protein ACI90Z_000772 [Cyanobium sp.]|jgi:hypothetical protein
MDTQLAAQPREETWGLPLPYQRGRRPGHRSSGEAALPSTTEPLAPERRAAAADRSNCQRSAEQPGNNLDQPCIGCKPVSTASSDLSPAGEISRVSGAFHGLLLAARRSGLDQRKFVAQAQIRRNGRLLFLRNLFGSRAGTPVLN